MTSRFEVYKCVTCTNVAEMITGGTGELVCCGAPMALLTEQTADAATEKHVPVIAKVDGGYKVTVGSTLHPMAEDHYIQWIELVADSQSHICFLKPGDPPEALFKVDATDVYAREHCNKHGLWKGTL